jgi:AP-3 complex subunit sigma
MIEAIFFLSKFGTCLFKKIYTGLNLVDSNSISLEVFKLISSNKDSSIIYDYSYQNSDSNKNKRVYFRYYGSYYIAFICDELENELATLDFINVMIALIKEILKGVNDEILSLNTEKVHLIIDEMISGGIVIETNSSIVLKNYNEMINLKS